MEHLFERQARLNVMKRPVRIVTYFFLIPGLIFAIPAWFVPAIASVFSQIIFFCLCGIGVVREIVRLRLMKSYLTPNIYRQTVQRVARLTIIGYVVAWLIAFVMLSIPSAPGYLFVLLLVWSGGVGLSVTRLNRLAKQIDPAYVSMGEIERAWWKR
ncbi:hypothetical protein ITJ88_00115 [Exiguobacterium sp. TBG-PICH-001]|uniref:hypothetical protein n=1 Tax=Exiguobacterium abrahamii TaxID=2785532 RepID=UPI0018A786BD|nr:hypothetical protein [Exiguobacterium sp. TBG-PICH-001]MBF8151669.1 hypothetical protein [Exiguobacterium sp. TBG-PICH-001]